MLLLPCFNETYALCISFAERGRRWKVEYAVRENEIRIDRREGFANYLEVLYSPSFLWSSRLLLLWNISRKLASCREKELEGNLASQNQNRECIKCIAFSSR
jgi:hypothetical protein